MTATAPRLVAALDLGSSRVAAAIGEVTGDPRSPGVRILGVGSEKTAVESYSEPVLDPITLGIATQDFGVKTKVADFVAKHAVLSFATDQSAAEIALGCGGTKGLTGLTFTGVNGASTLSIP